MNRRELRELVPDVGVAAIGVVALVLHGVQRRWWVLAVMASLLVLQVLLAMQRRRVRQVQRKLAALSSPASGAGSSESRPPARAPE